MAQPTSLAKSKQVSDQNAKAESSQRLVGVDGSKEVSNDGGAIGRPPPATLAHGNYETDLVFDKPAGLQSVAVHPVGLKSSVLQLKVGDLETHQKIDKQEVFPEDEELDSNLDSNRQLIAEADKDVDAIHNSSCDFASSVHSKKAQ